MGEIELPLGEVAGDIQGEGEGGVLKEGEHPLLNWNLEEMKKKEGLGFGFSAGGLLFPYFVGNAVALKRLGLITEDTVFAGSSAGSLISAFLGKISLLVETTNQPTTMVMLKRTLPSLLACLCFSPHSFLPMDAVSIYLCIYAMYLCYVSMLCYALLCVVCG